MLAAESLLRDQKNPQGALDVLASLQVPANNRFMTFQRAMLQADAYETPSAAVDELLTAVKQARRSKEPHDL
jgi:hypothetical protein